MYHTQIFFCHHTDEITTSVACKTHFLAYSLISSVPSVCASLNRTVRPGSYNSRPLVRQRPQRKVHNIVVHKASCCFANLLKPTTFFRFSVFSVEDPLAPKTGVICQDTGVKIGHCKKVTVSRGSALEACATDET